MAHCQSTLSDPRVFATPGQLLSLDSKHIQPDWLHPVGGVVSPAASGWQEMESVLACFGSWLYFNVQSQGSISIALLAL